MAANAPESVEKVIVPAFTSNTAPENILRGVSDMDCAVKLRAEAASLTAEADRLTNEAYRLEQTARALEQEREWRAAYGKRKRLIRDFAMELARGEDRQWVLDRAERFLDLRPGAAAQLIETFARSSRWVLKQRRNREILRLARRGWTNGELARKFELSEKHVSRVINERLRWPIT